MALHLKNRRSVLLGATAIVGALTLMGQPAAAQDQPEYEFNIPAQPLNSALRAYGVAADQQLIFADADLRGRSAPPLKGSYTAEQALNTLLAGTGLYVHRRDTGVLQISASSDPQSGSAAGDGADQGTVAALVVTAQKREENIQDVPIAMSAFTQEDLTRSQVAGGPDLMTQVPNFTFTKTNFSGYSIQIRGIGTQAISATVDPAVAVAFNNTPFIRNRFFEQEFYDLERVEVLRGPQGTLYGRNATAGVVNIISAKPNSHSFQARLSGDVSNYNSSRLEGMINLPLVDDKAALRVAGAWTKRDGFVKNTLTGQQTDGRDLWSARVSLGLTPTDWFKANLIYEHFSENDDRLRSGKQLCHRDPGPAAVNGVAINPTGDPVFASEAAEIYWTQGCLPASLYSPDAFEVPNGYALPYGPAAGLVGSPVDYNNDPYLSRTQSRNLREIETRVKPEYTASNDTVELQLQFELPRNLTLTSETGFNRDSIFSFEDFNRFNTRPGIFHQPEELTNVVVQPDGSLCDPQLGCSDRMTAADLSTADSKQFSQEFRISSNYEGPVNFSLGANFLRYDTEDKYYVFFNTLSAITISTSFPTCAFRSNNGYSNNGYAWSSLNRVYPLSNNCGYLDTNNIHSLDDEGRNYFLSKNPYHLLSYAAFGEVYWQLTPDLKVTGGLRWTDDRKTAPQIPSWLLAGLSYGTPTRKVIEQEWKEPTGRLAIDWKPHLSFTDETLLYGSYVRGYKAGGANPPGYIVVSVLINAPFYVAQTSLTHPETFKPEFVDAYEIGTKNTLLDGRLTFNLNAFYYNYTGYQISQIVDRSAVNLNFDAKIWGSELEVDWRPLENVRLGFKGGYENTRLADGSHAIDLMDRTAGQPGWLVRRPFPTVASNCIVPEPYAFFAVGANGDRYNGCFMYLRPDLLPFTAPNNGEGFAKDLSGNNLPNAPHFTATITADYTLPLPSDWLMTLHTDLYYQSEAWTRIFNTPGYDKLKAYNNINVAAIFSNEDRGWQIMAYVKNLLNKDNITGAFLNSDDTGLTTNVFLNEPRLYGIRVTKNWASDVVPGGILGDHKPGAPYPFRLEADGYYGRFMQAHERFAPPYSTLFNADFPHHDDGQSDLDRGEGGGFKFTYSPNQGPWNVSASIRYGRAQGRATPHAKQGLSGTPCVSIFGYTLICEDLATHVQTTNGVVIGIDPTNFKYNFYDAMTHNSESHTMADFMVGRDFGIGSSQRAITSTLNAGLAYARLQSSQDLTLHVRPDTYFPPYVLVPPFPDPAHWGRVHRLNADEHAEHEFEGAGPSLAWAGNLAFAGQADGPGRVGVEAGVGGSILFGKQKSNVYDHRLGAYTGGPISEFAKYDLAPAYNTTVNHIRDKRVTVPAVNANLGLSYELGRLRVSGGYRIERYFKAIDGGVETRKTYDRQFDGPYFKVSVGFGG